MRRQQRRVDWLLFGAAVILLLAIVVLQPGSAVSGSADALVASPCTPTASATFNGDTGGFDHILPGAKVSSATPPPCPTSTLRVNPLVTRKASTTVTASTTATRVMTSTPTHVLSATPSDQVVPNIVYQPLNGNGIIVTSNLQEPAPNYIPNNNCTLAEAIKAVNTKSQIDQCRGDMGYTTILLYNNIKFTLSANDNISATGSNDLPVLTGNPLTGNTITIDGNNSIIENDNLHNVGRLFEVASGTNATLKNLTLQGGFIQTWQDGGAIYNHGTLTLSGIILQNGGSANYGGAVLNAAGATLNLTTSYIFQNTAYYGGGINNFGTLHIAYSVFTNNATSYGNAGAVSNLGSGTGTIDRTIFRLNGGGANPPSQSAGAIYNASTGTLSVTNSCFLNNSFNNGKQAVVNSTPVNPAITAPTNWWVSDGTKSAAGTDGRPGPVGPNTTPNADTISSNIAWNPAMGTLPTFCIAPIFGPPQQDFVGVFRPSDSTFHLRKNNAPNSGEVIFGYGYAGVYPVVGDWDGDGTDTVGVYNQSNGLFQLTNINAASTPSYTFTFGNPGDIPIAGRWSVAAQHDGVGVFRPSNGLIYLKNELTGGFSDMALLYGSPGDQPITGYWDTRYPYADGLGIYRPSSSVFYLENDVCNCQSFSDFNFAFPTGIPNPKALAGDWNSLAHLGVGVFDGTHAIFYLKNELTTGAIDYAIPYGQAGDIPIAGHWGDPCSGSGNGQQSGGTCQVLQTPNPPCPWSLSTPPSTPDYASGMCTYTFDANGRKAAANYAVTWQNKACSLFCSFEYSRFVATPIPTPTPDFTCQTPSNSTDCANFVSQALFYGGLPMTVGWYCQFNTTSNPSICVRGQGSSPQPSGWASALRSLGLPQYLGDPISQTGAIGLGGIDTARCPNDILSPAECQDLASNIQAGTTNGGGNAPFADPAGQPSPRPTQVDPSIDRTSFLLNKIGLSRGDIMYTNLSGNEHVFIMVGWGPYVVTWSQLGAVNLQEIKATRETTNLVPYVVDHGPHELYALSNSTTGLKKEGWRRNNSG